MVWPTLRREPASRSSTSDPSAPVRSGDPGDDRVDAFSAGCALSVVGLLYAAFLIRAGEDAERVALSLTAAIIGVALLVRCAWRRRRARR